MMCYNACYLIYSGLSVREDQNKFIVFFFNSFSLILFLPVQQIEGAKARHRNEICPIAWNIVGLGQVLSLGVKRNTST